MPGVGGAAGRAPPPEAAGRRFRRAKRALLPLVALGGLRADQKRARIACGRRSRPPLTLDTPAKQPCTARSSFFPLLRLGPPKAVLLPDRLPVELEDVGVVDQPVADRVGQCVVADERVPVLGVELARDHG